MAVTTSSNSSSSQSKHQHFLMPTTAFDPALRSTILASCYSTNPSSGTFQSFHYSSTSEGGTSSFKCDGSTWCEMLLTWLLCRGPVALLRCPQDIRKVLLHSPDGRFIALLGWRRHRETSQGSVRDSFVQTWSEFSPLFEDQIRRLLLVWWARLIITMQWGGWIFISLYQIREWSLLRFGIMSEKLPSEVLSLRREALMPRRHCSSFSRNWGGCRWKMGKLPSQPTDFQLGY